jgi:hypothetical protein
MTNRQKEIQSYVFVALLIFAVFADSIYSYKKTGYNHSIDTEYKTGQHWVMDLKGNPLGDY